MHDENKLRAFGALIMRMQHGGNLTREEVAQAGRQIWQNQTSEIQQGMFIEALRAKGETLDELAGIIDSFEAEWFRHMPGDVAAAKKHLGLAGVGMDSLKTVNVSSGASLIVSCCGVYVHKVCGPGMTGVSGSHDVFALLGVDPNTSHERVYASIREIGLGYTSVVGSSAAKTGSGRVLGQIRCATSLHPAGPICKFSEDERHKMLGVPHPSHALRAVKLMQSIGYETGISPCGASDHHEGRYMDEFSNVGVTKVARLLPDGRLLEYEVTPEDAGLERRRYEDIAAASTREENVHAMISVLAGKHEDGPVLELLALNAAAILEYMGEVDNLAAGVERAREAVASGRVEQQIKRLIRCQNVDPEPGLAQYEAFIARDWAR